MQKFCELLCHAQRRLEKITRIMRLTAGLILFAIITASGINTYSQNARLNLNLKNATIVDIFREIERTSEFGFFFKSEELNLEKRQTVSISNATIDEVLRKVLDENYSYKILDKNIVVTKGDLVNAIQQQQGRKVTGKVTNRTGALMVGVTVAIKGTNLGTFTDIAGNFIISVPSESKSLFFSYVGMKALEVDITDKSSVSVIMEEELFGINEVVVTALGIQKESRSLSYNVQELNGREAFSTNEANFMSSLSGKIAGVTINSSASGIGGATRVIMRGPKSITKSNNALYVIDGVPLINSSGGQQEGIYSGQVSGESISDFNPEDIESISALTGPAAAALYGSAAANGAILITTKKGTAGDIKITVSNSTDFITPFVTPRFQNTYGNKPGEYGSWGSKLNTPSDYNPLNFFQTGTNITNSVSLSTGTKKNQTYASFAATNASGIIPNNEYNRYNFNIRNTAKFLNDKMTLDLNAGYVIQNDQNMISQGQYFNPLMPVYLFPRGDNFDKVRLYERYDEGRKIDTQFWPYGDQGMQMQNPYWIINKNMYGTEKNRYMFSSGLKYEILDWMNITGRVRVDNSANQDYKKYYAGTATLFSGSEGFYALSKTYDKQAYADALLNINKTFKKFSITANIGASISDSQSDLTGLQGPLLSIPNFFAFNNIDLAGRDARPLQSGWHQQTQSVFASTELGYKSTVYLSATGRNDWASMLANSAEPSFFYPSLGLSAIVTKMVSLPEFISFAKVRGSFSSVGSAPERYLTVQTFSYNADKTLETNAFMPIPKLKAERTKSYEAGLDLKFFMNKLNLKVTYYRSNTYNQMFQATASPSSGYSSFYIQAGNVANKGVEASLGVNTSFGPVNWNATTTFSLNRNKIVELVNNYPDPITGNLMTIEELNVSGTGTFEMLLKKGGSIGDMYTTTELRKDNQGGVWVDPNSNSIAIVNKIQKVGNASPKCNLGFRNDFTYKNFNLGFLLTARIGGEVISATQAIMDKFGVSEQSAIMRDNRGVPLNNGKMDPEYFYGIIGGGQTGMLSNYVYSATNIRFQEATFGYMLPKKWFNGKMEVNLALSGRNLLMIYNKAPFDPELVASTSTYYQGIDYFMQPSTRNLGFKIGIKF